MRRASDMSSRRRVPRFSARLVLVVIALTILFVIVFGRAMARFYVDALWFDSLGRSDVFWGQIRASRAKGVQPVTVRASSSDG